MQLSEENRHTFLLAVHQLIEEYASGSANDLLQGRTDQLDYPPNGGFTTEEQESLKQLQDNVVLQSAMRKVLASCAGGVVFGLLNLIDGTNEPEHGDWSGVMLVDEAEAAGGSEFLHDDFFESYWDWREKRKNKDWRLDLLPE
ncbi:hypothetical protein [Hymenobacter antarcticus]|uniref:Uncharacterized protein n=1 Tax=Hymenobacter antarcticus TaxID=486270 RepID=A0ABP7QAY5_9BACT